MKQSTLEALERYRDYGIATGDFLFSVMINNLSRTIAHADEQNLADLVEIVRFVYNDMPSGCWGTEDKVRDWMMSGGLKGRETAHVN